MRRALGVAVFSGMLGVTAFGLFFTPVFYTTVRWVVDRATRRRPAGPSPAAPAGGHPADGVAPAAAGGLFATEASSS
jgi:hypothetical protein